MELIPALATIIVIATVVTIVFALLSYLAYRSGQRKRPKPSAGAAEPQFVKRYKPHSA
jgi:hypothetical protein